MDTRVLFEHFGWKLKAADRFASDLGEVDLISHPLLKEFTAAALEAPIPVLLGGHSLVTGGLWALIDAAARVSTIEPGGIDVLKRIKDFFDPTERELKRLETTVQAINDLEPEMQALTDSELRGKTDYFYQQLNDGATLDDILPEACSGP